MALKRSDFTFRYVFIFISNAFFSSITFGYGGSRQSKEHVWEFYCLYAEKYLDAISFYFLNFVIPFFL